MNKISIIGAGNVGASVAQLIVQKGLANVVLFDIIKGLPQGKCLDLMQATPLYASNCQITGTNDYKDIKDSDIVVIAAGFARKPGMSRTDLLDKNAVIIKEVCQGIKKYMPKGIAIVATNPLDTIAYLAYKMLGFPHNKVIGMAGMLDTSRFKAFIAQKLKISANDVETIVLGGHGKFMVPMPEHTQIKGKPITNYLNPKEIESLVKRTRNAGAEIVALLKTGSAYYAAAAAIVDMIEAILQDSKKIVPASAYLNGEYGYTDMFIGVPVRLGKLGVEEVIELELAKNEKDLLDVSARHVEKNKQLLGLS
ncbi:MAG: malate dehydrogenase [Nanoarchaeota archaeon]|nr:malate dehydrogenase [Nanoarchaeota archaeon]